MERNDNLVVLNSYEAINISNTIFEPNVVYRSIKLSDTNSSEILVYGVIFSEDEFNHLFKSAQILIVEELKELGIIVNDRLISKSKFSNLLSIHQYGRTTKSGFKVGLLYNENPKKLMYVFMPLFTGDTKKNTINVAYNHLKQILSGNMEPFYKNLVQRTNTGIPLSMSPNHIFSFDTKRNVKNFVE